jgi:hypothetical protein
MCQGMGPNIIFIIIFLILGSISISMTMPFHVSHCEQWLRRPPGRVLNSLCQFLMYRKVFMKKKRCFSEVSRLQFLPLERSRKTYIREYFKENAAQSSNCPWASKVHVTQGYINILWRKVLSSQVQRWTQLRCLYRDNDQSFPWRTRYHSQLQTGKWFYRAHPLITRIVVYNLYFSWSTYAWKPKKLHRRRGREVTTQNQSKLTCHLEVKLKIPPQRPSSLLCFRYGVHELHCKPQSLLDRDSQETTSSTKNSETTKNSALLTL